MNTQLSSTKCQQQQQQSLSLDPEMFDLQGLLKTWAINTYVLTATRKQKKLKVENLLLRIVWQDLIVTHAKPEYFEDQLIRLPKAHVLFSTAFRNKTSSEQEYSFRTERSTRSVAEVEIERGIVLSKEVSLKLGVSAHCCGTSLAPDVVFTDMLQLFKCIHPCNNMIPDTLVDLMPH